MKYLAQLKIHKKTFLSIRGDAVQCWFRPEVNELEVHSMVKMFTTLRKERQNKNNDSGRAYVINKIIHIVGLTRTKPTVVYLMQ